MTPPMKRKQGRKKAKPDDKNHAARRVSHLSFSQSPVVENAAKIDHHAYFSETDEQKEEREGEKLLISSNQVMLWQLKETI